MALRQTQCPDAAVQEWVGRETKLNFALPRKAKGPGERTEALTPAGISQPTCPPVCFAGAGKRKEQESWKRSRAAGSCNTNVLHSLWLSQSWSVA